MTKQTYPPLLIHPLSEGGAIVGVIIEEIDGMVTLIDALRFNGDSELVEVFEKATPVSLEPQATFVQEAFWSGLWAGSQLRLLDARHRELQETMGVLEQQKLALRRMTEHWAYLDDRDRGRGQ